MTPDHETLQSLPVLPLKNSVVFPSMFIPLAAGRPGFEFSQQVTGQSEENACHGLNR